jgi:hypothetical protein
MVPRICAVTMLYMCTGGKGKGEFDDFINDEASESEEDSDSDRERHKKKNKSSSKKSKASKPDAAKDNHEEEEEEIKAAPVSVLCMWYCVCVCVCVCILLFLFQGPSLEARHGIEKRNKEYIGSTLQCRVYSIVLSGLSAFSLPE